MKRIESIRDIVNRALKYHTSQQEQDNLWHRHKFNSFLRSKEMKLYT